MARLVCHDKDTPKTLTGTALMSVSNSRAPQSHADLSCRLVALLVFLLGIGILTFVFVTALHLFQSPVPGLETLQTPGAPPPAAANIGLSLAGFARELLLLGVMTLAGSLLANKGAHLYFSAAYSASPTAVPATAPPQEAVAETSHNR
jgi:hypothetical protein